MKGICFDPLTKGCCLLRNINAKQSLYQLQNNCNSYLWDYHKKRRKVFEGSADQHRHLILLNGCSHSEYVFESNVKKMGLWQYMSRKWEVTEPWVVTNGTGPLACLSLFPVAEVDKESND